MTLQTNGQYVVGSYVPLSYEPLEGRGVTSRSRPEAEGRGGARTN